ESIGEGSVFDWYYLVSTTNGVTSGPFDATYTLKFEKDVPTRGDAFKMYKEGATSTKINSGFGFLEANHLTKPSVFFSNTDAYVYINGILYKIKNIKDPENITSFKISDILVLMKPAKETTDLTGKLAKKDMKSR